MSLLDLKAPQINVQDFTHEEIESNGRPTFFIQKPVTSIASDQIAVKTPLMKQNKGIVFKLY